MHGVDAQSVAVKLVDPLQRVVDEEPAHVVAARPVEIERESPRRFVAIGEVRTELGEVVSFRTEVVVDHVEENRETALMTGIDESLERARTAVRILRRVRIRAIVSPVARAGKLRDRKQLDRGNAEVAQRVEARNDRVERRLRRERAGMQLIDYVVFERDAAPSRVVPF